MVELDQCSEHKKKKNIFQMQKKQPLNAMLDNSLSDMILTTKHGVCASKAFRKVIGIPECTVFAGSANCTK